MKFNETTLERIFLNIHFEGRMGKMGSLNQKQRLAYLVELQRRGFLDGNCKPTKLGREMYRPIPGRLYLAQLEDEAGTVVATFFEKTEMDFKRWQYTVAIPALRPKGQTLRTFINSEEQFLNC